MSYNDKIKAARALLEKHNKSLDKDVKIDIDKIFKELSSIGGQTEDALRQCKYEDLESCGFPRLLARQTAETIFRTQKTDKPTFIKMSLARSMNIDQLIEAYDSRESDNNVGKVLSEKSEGKPFIVFSDDGSINKESSISLLNEIRDGHEPREFYTVNGIPCEIYAVGDRPDRLGSVNPLFPSEILRPDGTCSQTNRSWQGISDEICKIMFLARSDTNEFVLNSVQDAHNILDMIITDDAITKVRQRFPKAVIRLKQLRDEGNEPSLRKPIGRNSGSRSNDPFHGSRHTRS
jgi:hypothetical protein